MVRRQTLKPLQIPLVNVLSKHRWNVNVETTVCFNQSPSPPLQSQGVDSKNLRETRGGGTDRYKDMKRGRHTRRKEKDLLPCLKNKTKDFNLTARKRQPLLIESGMENRNRSLKCGGTATLWP